MISKRTVTKKYAELMNEVATNPFYTKERTKKVNCYVCEKCRQILKTIDVDTGTIPFMIRCDVCDGYAQSKMYNDIAPNLKPKYEWFRPTLKEVLKMRNKPQLLEHILNGGLERRKIIES